MRMTPSPVAPSAEADSSDRCLTETGGDGEVEGDGIPEVSGDPDNVPGSMEDDGSHLPNGPVVELPQPHSKILDIPINQVTSWIISDLIKTT